MRLSSKLARLEEKAQRVISCAWCRYNLVPLHKPTLTNPYTAAPPQSDPDRALVSCFFCGNQYWASLGGVPAKYRAYLLRWYCRYDGETYRDEKVFAAKRRTGYWWALNALKDPPEQTAQPYRRGQDKKPTRHERERAALKEQAEKLVADAKAREKKLYGPRTFPLAARLEELEKAAKVDEWLPGYSGKRSDAEVEALKCLALARCMEACELVLWGEADPETLSEIEARTVEAEGFEREREEKRRAEGEEKRRREEERERQRLEAVRRQNPAPVQLDPLPPDNGFKGRRAIYPKHEISRPSWEPQESKSQPPPDDGTIAYQQKLAHWRRTGVWLPDVAPRGSF